MNKEQEIMKFGEWFLRELSALCLDHCGRSLSAIQFPVFKKFLAHRIKREIEFYHLCLSMAVVLVETGTELADDDIAEIIEESRDLDKRFKRDITLLPVRVHFDYDEILPLRRERTRLQTLLFARLLRVDGGDYHAMARRAFTKDEFFDLHNELLELYADEAFIINNSLKSIIDIDTEGTAYRVHCSMIDIGIRLNKTLADTIFGS